MAEKLPVTVLTGFLGSGKTTLLARLLASPALGDTALIVNELGDVPIDHHVLRRVDERTVVLASGCVCCTLRGDLSDELLDLLDRRSRGELTPFRRVVVETTGLADPAPIMATLAHDRVVPHHFELDRVITTVDGQRGVAGLEREPESVKQAAVADRLVVTKTDIADHQVVERLVSRLRALNPVATVHEVAHGEIEPSLLLADLEPGQAGHARDRAGHARPLQHQSDVRAFCLTLDEPLDWTAFGVWLTMLLQARGRDVLRVKGLLDVGDEGPLLVNGVQHVVYPPEHLETWPNGDRRSQLVLIARGVEREQVEESLFAFAASGHDDSA